jgi:multicomponent Na+:H+ antiporter subunit F
MFYEIIGLMVLVSIAISLIRLLSGPTAFDRMLAIDTITTLIMVLIIIYAFIEGNMMFIDVAILYSLLNFIGTLSVAKYFLKEKTWSG